MTKSVLKVVFDTNVFTPKHFDLLANGPLVSLCKAGRIIPVYGHVFLEEMWRAYGNESRRGHLVERWIPFIVESVSRFCDDFITIWHRELIEGHGPNTNIYMHPRAQRVLITGLANIPLDGSWTAWHETQEERAKEDAKRTAQRNVSKEIRQEVAVKLKKIGYCSLQYGDSVAFEKFLQGEIDRAGREYIEVLVRCRDPGAVANRWSRGKRAYPYFTTFVTNMIYMAYYSATRPNDGIDLNAQADLDLMTHLLHADVLVSNETGFLRKAFEDLWRQKNKVIFTSQEFVVFSNKLV